MNRSSFLTMGLILAVIVLSNMGSYWAGVEKAESDASIVQARTAAARNLQAEKVKWAERLTPPPRSSPETLTEIAAEKAAEEPEENKEAALVKELTSHFKEVAAHVSTPYGEIVVGTTTIRTYGLNDTTAAVIFQTGDDHWWRVLAERNKDGSWYYDSPSREDSPFTYDTEASLAVVPPYPD